MCSTVVESKDESFSSRDRKSARTVWTTPCGIPTLLVDSAMGFRLSYLLFVPVKVSGHLASIFRMIFSASVIASEMQDSIAGEGLRSS